MPGPSWGQDSAEDEVAVAANVAALLTNLVRHATPRRPARVALAHDWHREIYRGVGSVPAPHYLGGVRGGGHPDLAGYEVVLGVPGSERVLARGAPSAEVHAQLQNFDLSLKRVTATLDQAISPRGPADQAQLLAAVELSAVLHGEWVRIHPYANGNGRIARTWANWAAIRYGLPPFVAIKPRPDGLLYGRAAQLSMGLPPSFVADHDLTVQVFLELLRRRI